jgi:hypothetical protein
MARRTRIVSITAQGRDFGKQFLLTEMPADQAERWALRAFLALANANVKLPDGAADAGMAGIAATMETGALLKQGIQSLAGLSYAQVGDLLDEMFTCIQFQPPNGMPPQPLWSGENSQIEEVSTRLKLRWEVVQLHTDFFTAVASWSTPETSAAATAPA